MCGPRRGSGAGAGCVVVVARATTRGPDRRRWRALDLGTVRAEVEADAPRVACPEHGVVVASVPGPAAAGSRQHRPRTIAAIEHNLSNGLIESVNTKIRLITRIAFGSSPNGPPVTSSAVSTDLSSHPTNCVT